MTLSTTAKTILHLIDLTSLNDDDSEESIILLCQKACSEVGNVAAICVYPKFIKIAHSTLQKCPIKDIKIATVINFPAGEDNIEKVILDTQEAVNLGANEVDLVFPYKQFIKGNTKLASSMIKACKKACGEHVLLKVIIESGELKQQALIESACQIAISAGADFIKTSTGKVKINATLQAAEIILACISRSKNKAIGFKAAGGISSVEEAEKYLNLAETIMGSEWIKASHFRFGASSLLNDVLKKLGTHTSPSTNAY